MRNSRIAVFVSLVLTILVLLAVLMRTTLRTENLRQFAQASCFENQYKLYVEHTKVLGIPRVMHRLQTLGNVSYVEYKEYDQSGVALTDQDVAKRALDKLAKYGIEANCRELTK